MDRKTTSRMLGIISDLERDASSLDPLQVEEAFEQLFFEVLLSSGYAIREREPDSPAFDDGLDVGGIRGHSLILTPFA